MNTSAGSVQFSSQGTHLSRNPIYHHVWFTSPDFKFARQSVVESLSAPEQLPNWSLYCPHSPGTCLLHVQNYYVQNRIILECVQSQQQLCLPFIKVQCGISTRIIQLDPVKIVRQAWKITCIQIYKTQRQNKLGVFKICIQNSWNQVYEHQAHNWIMSSVPSNNKPFDKRKNS